MGWRDRGVALCRLRWYLKVGAVYKGRTIGRNFSMMRMSREVRFEGRVALIEEQFS